MKNKLYLLFFAMLSFHWLGATALNGSISTDATDCTSYNSNDGAIDLTVDGGFAPFDFEWSNGATTEDINNLSPGEYCVTVTDALCGEATTCVIVCAPMQIAFDDYEPCPGEYFGELLVANILGGQAPYSYEWNTGQTGYILQEITAGNYCVTVTDGNGCTSTECFDLQNAPGCSNDDCPNSIYGIYVDEHPCFGLRNGSMTVYLDQGYTAQSYLWSNGATTATNSNIFAGFYCVTVTDVNACTSVACKTLTEQTSPITLFVGTSPASGPNAYDGALFVGASGGNPPYTYSWTGPNGYTSNVEDISGLLPGTYCLRIRSAGCFETTRCYDVGYNCPSLIADIDDNGTIACEGETGTLSVLLTGQGTPPYSYIWNNGATTETITNLQPGFFSVTVTDGVGCVEREGHVLTLQNEPIEIEASVTDEMCDTGSGAITLFVSGGVAPYSYVWENGSTQKDRTNLSVGSYCVTVTDAEGCDSESCFQVEDGPNTLLVQIVGKENSSNCTDTGEPGPATFCDGSIDIEINGSDGPFTYSWIGPDDYESNQEDPSNLCPGNYSVTVTTASGCVGVRTIQICCCSIFSPGPSAPSNFENCYSNPDNTTMNLGAYVSKISTTGADDGYIDLSVLGGTGTFYYNWSGPGSFSSTDQDIYNLSPGTYCVTVSDGCSREEECYEIVDCALENLAISGSVINTCWGYNYGIITTNASGGSSPYSYAWSNGSSAASPSNFSTGNHCVTVTDANGCTATNCWNVGGSSETQSIVNCGYQYSCNGNPTNFVPYNGPPAVTYAGCRTEFILCPLTGDIIGVNTLPYAGFAYDWNNCRIVGLCPVSGAWETVAFGSFSQRTELIFLSDCGCFGCFDITTCIMPDGAALVVNVVQVNLDNCPPPGPDPLKGDDQEDKVLLSELQLNELIYALKSNKVLQEDAQIYIPEPLSEHMLLSDYVDGFETLMSKGEKLIPIYPLLPENELKDMKCSEIECGRGETDGGKGNERTENATSNTIEIADFNATVYPNPFTDELNISLEVPEAQTIQVSLFDLLGKSVLRQDFEMESGSQILNLNTLQKLPSGVYQVQIQGENGMRSTHKVTHTFDK